MKKVVNEESGGDVIYYISKPTKHELEDFVESFIHKGVRVVPFISRRVLFWTGISEFRDGKFYNELSAIHYADLEEYVKYLVINDETWELRKTNDYREIKVGDHFIFLDKFEGDAARHIIEIIEKIEKEESP